MFVGKPVTVVSRGRQKLAAVVEVLPEPGASGFKRLSLTTDRGVVLKDVPHERDAVKGQPFWREGAPHDDPEALPDGYTAEGGEGGYFTLTAPDGSKVSGPSRGKFKGKEAAAEAAWHHRETTDTK